MTEQSQTRLGLRIVVLGLAPLLGLLALMLPTLVTRPPLKHPTALFPVLDTAIENIGQRELVLLFVVGLLLGAVLRELFWAIGWAGAMLLPLAAFAEMIHDPTSHNLWPFEFVVYLFYGVVIGLGALVSQGLWRLIGSAGQRQQ